jgi:polyadenylation factor subunit 2
MMRDVFLLRGHENEITSLAWHPIHRNLLSTGGHSGAIHHYLLDEQNPPPGAPFSLSPYDSPEPQSAPAQTIFPAHSVLHAHDPTGPIWSMSWHPLGHILASGSNDRVTRFWARARPGDTSYLNDRFHIGQQAAEESGTYNKNEGRRQQHEAEELEAMDEEEGLVEQQVGPSPPLPGQLPGLQLPGIAPPPGSGGGPLPGFPGHLPLNGLAAPPDPAQLQGLVANIDLEKLKKMFGGLLPLGPGGVPLPPGQLPPGFLPPPPGSMGQGALFPPPPGQPMGNGGSRDHDGEVQGIKRRGPLPSQEEMRRIYARNNK